MAGAPNQVRKLSRAIDVSARITEENTGHGASRRTVDCAANREAAQGLGTERDHGDAQGFI
jgi:hypothetical protein